jgi:hypothetical protein
MSRFTIALLVLLPLSSLNAQDLTHLEKVLVPVLNQGKVIEGANHSKFQTAFGVWAGEPFLFTYYPALPPENDDPPTRATIDIPSSGVNLWEAPVIAKGRFLFVDAFSVKRPMFARLISTQPDGKRASTPLPVVKAADVRTGKSTLGWIVNDALFDRTAPLPLFTGYRQRHTLRVYDWDSTGQLQVTVRLRAGTFWATQRDVSRVIDVRTRDFDEASYPYYAEVNLEQLFGTTDWCTPTPRTRCGDFLAVIEVEPLHPAARYYAFISTTENDTGHVTIHTPH